MRTIVPPEGMAPKLWLRVLAEASVAIVEYTDLTCMKVELQPAGLVVWDPHGHLESGCATFRGIIQEIIVPELAEPITEALLGEP